MRPFFLLLLISTTVLAIDEHPTENVDFILKIFNLKLIQEPSHPIFYQGIAFYWYGAYIPSSERPQTCIILASDPEWPFEGSIFKNGTIPTAAAFGCHQGYLCQGTRCVKSFTHFNVVTYTLIGIILLLIVCHMPSEPKTKRRQQIERPRRPSPRESRMDFLPIDNHRVRYALPPGYTQ